MKSRWNQIRFSPFATVLIVFVAMFLDGALLTTVVPIIPEVLAEIKLNNKVRLPDSSFEESFHF